MAESVFDCRPFSLDAGDPGCLLIHGFTATPYDMRFFGEQLHQSGYSAHAVCLPGHASRVEEMERHSWRDWYAAASDALDQVGSPGAPRVVIGQSMGALLALKLAHDRPDLVAAVVSISTALVASNKAFRWVAPVIPFVRPLLPSKWHYLAKGDSDIADPQARAEGQAYRRMPLHSMHQLHSLQRHVRRLLPRIRQPVLAIHARQDHACPLANVGILQREVPGPVETVLLDNSFHVVSVDCDRVQASEAIREFIARRCADTRNR